MNAAPSGRRRSRLASTVPMVAMLVWLTACIPGGDGKFHACLTTATGAVRLIDFDTTQTCNTGEKLVAWNQTGSSRLGGGVRFLDKLDATGYLGVVDDVAVSLSAADATFTTGVAGALSAFQAQRQAGGADVTYTLLKNGSATAISCTVAGVATSCTDPDAVTVTASDSLVVRVTQPGSTFARYVRWSALLVGP